MINEYIFSNNVNIAETCTSMYVALLYVNDWQLLNWQLLNWLDQINIVFSNIQTLYCIFLFWSKNMSAIYLARVWHCFQKNWLIAHIEWKRLLMAYWKDCSWLVHSVCYDVFAIKRNMLHFEKFSICVFIVKQRFVMNNLQREIKRFHFAYKI